MCLCVGLSNPEEFSFTSDEETQEQTLRRAGHQARDQKRLDTLKKKLHTDDECKQQKWEYLSTYDLSILWLHVAS